MADDAAASDPSKLYTTKYVYKAIILLFLLLLPLFPCSIAPDFTLHATSWELLQLVFVGIAVSYGLFSNRIIHQLDKESQSQSHSQSQLCLSKLLQVSSVFDDESETHTLIEEEDDDDNDNKKKVETLMRWNGGCEGKPKPLILPVRSLNQRSMELDSQGDIEVGGLSFRKKTDQNLFVLGTESNWMIDEDESTSTPKKPTPRTSSFPSESQAKSNEDDLGRKKNYCSSSPPPAPPPPPPSSVLSMSNSSFHRNNAEKKVLRRRVESFPIEELISESEREDDRLHSQKDVLAKSVRTYIPNELVVGAEKTSTDYDKASMLIDKKVTNGEFAVEKLVVMETSDEDSDAESIEEEEEDFVVGSLGNEEANNGNNTSSTNDVGPDVDKKADEFIAKFREQIRQQRIESIRRSTAQRAGKTLR